MTDDVDLTASFEFHRDLCVALMDLRAPCAPLAEAIRAAVAILKRGEALEALTADQRKLMKQYGLALRLILMGIEGMTALCANAEELAADIERLSVVPKGTPRH
jgi:hypothetical protein